jgi:hypothetical protein
VRTCTRTRLAGARCACRQHGVERPLWYALRYCRAWLARRFPTDLPLAHRRRQPVIRLMDWVLPRCTLPRVPDRPAEISRRIAGRLGVLRYQWLRMPPGLLLRHLTHKGLQSLRPSTAAQRNIR